MNKEIKAKYEYKLYMKQCILLRAFFINIAIICIAWLATLSNGLMAWTAFLTNISIEQVYSGMFLLLGVWDVAGVLLFLVPALAIYWERKSLKKFK